MSIDAREYATCFDFPENAARAEEMEQIVRRAGRIQTLINELVGLLSDTSSNVRVGAVEALGSIKEANCPEVIEALIKVLPDEVQRDYSYGGLYADEDDMRTPGQCAAQVLGRWQATAAIPAMIEILTKPRGWLWNTIACMRALGQMKAKEAIPALQRLTPYGVTAIWGVYSIDEKVHIGQLAKQVIDSITSEDEGSTERPKRTITIGWHDREDDCSLSQTIEVDADKDPVRAARDWFAGLLDRNPGLRDAGGSMIDIEFINEELPEGRSKTLEIEGNRIS